VVATQIPMQQLELVKEAKILDIVEGSPNPRLEASGVLAKDGLCYVIFDNLPHVACISPELSRTARDNHMIIQDKGYRRGFEDIAYDPWLGRFYILIESLPRGRAKFMAAVQEYDATFRYVDSAWLDFPLDRANKGLEGLTCIRREEQSYLLGLCEGNRCKGGADGRIPGGGRIQVFQRGRRNWDRVGKIRLPETVLFEDYSGIAVTGDRIAVISQVSSALWLGSLAPSGWQITGAGTSYALPRASDGSIAYGTVEGVSWIAPDQVVMVSDKAKPEQDHRCRAKDQSIHIFRIPSPGRPLAARPAPRRNIYPSLGRLGIRGSGVDVFYKSTRGVEVCDENVDPCAAERGPDGRVLGGSAGHTDTSGHLHKVGRSNTHNTLVERCLYGGASNVEEPEANVADCSGVPELVLFGFGECVTALAQQG